MVRMLKYPLDGILTNHECTIRMPYESKIKYTAMQQSMFGVGIMVWAEATIGSLMADHKFVLIPTGAEVPRFADYLKTFEVEMGMIFHLYLLPVVLDDMVVSEETHELDRD